MLAGSFSAVIQQLANIPLHVRGRAEAWETPRFVTSTHQHVIHVALCMQKTLFLGDINQFDDDASYRSQIKMMEKLGEGETGCVYKCRWRGLDCAAKILTHNSRTSVAVWQFALSHLSSDHSPVVPKCTMLVVVCNPRGHFAMMMAEMDTNPACLETAPDSTYTLDRACLINRFLYLPSFLSLIAIEDILHT
jgi:hypothetical protein